MQSVRERYTAECVNFIIYTSLLGFNTPFFLAALLTFFFSLLLELFTFLLSLFTFSLAFLVEANIIGFLIFLLGLKAV